MVLCHAHFWKKWVKKGFYVHGLMISMGLNADFAYSVIINEELEKVGTGLVGVGVHNDIVTPYIETFGSTDQKKRWLPSCISGETMTAIGMTEPQTGFDLASIKTTALKKEIRIF